MRTILRVTAAALLFGAALIIQQPRAQNAQSGIGIGTPLVNLNSACGTTAHTAKLIVSAGTGLPVTLLDNIGANVQGC